MDFKGVAVADFQWTSGLLLGLSAGIAPGPLLTLVISQSLRFGRREGVKVALAPLITDLPIITGALVIGSRIAGMPTLMGLLSFAGAAYICFLSWESITIGKAAQDPSPPIPKSFRRGILANLLNPHPYMFWLTVGTPMVITAWSIAPWKALVWLSGFYFMLVGAKILLAIIAGQSRHWLVGRGYVWLNRSLGFALLLLALLLAGDGFRLLGLWPS